MQYIYTMHPASLSHPFSCVVIDDDEIDRLTVLAFLSEYSQATIIDSFDSPEKALETVSTAKPDVLFLDVDMPGMNGIQMREKLMDVPACIFITAYPEYAVESFEKHALDFLVKPVNATRFASMMERLQEYLILRKKAGLLDYTIGADTVFIKEGREEIKLQLHDILYLEAMKDYTAVMTEKRKYLVSTPMGSLIQSKPFEQFVRIHRSYAVPKHFIRRIGTDELELDNAIRLPVGRAFKDALTRIKK